MGQAGHRVFYGDGVHWLEQQDWHLVGVGAAVGDEAALWCRSCDPGRAAAEKRVIQESRPAWHLGFGGHLLD